MERKKLPNDVGLDDLLNIATDDSEADVYVDDSVLKTDIASFIMAQKLESGDHPIRGPALYKIYKLWSKDPVGATKFHAELGLYIRKDNDYYLVNKSPTEMIADYSSAIKTKRHPRIRHRTIKVQFHAFLEKHKIEPGEEWIESHIVYHFYDKWIYEKNKNAKLKDTDITSLMRAVFENRNTKDGYVFKIKHNFSQESIANLREAWKKRKQSGPK